MAEKFTWQPWEIDDYLKDNLRAAIDLIFGHNLMAEAVSVAPPPNPDFGDLSTPVCLRLAKELRQAPMAIAAKVAEELRARDLALVRNITVTPPGYINFEFDYSQYAAGLLNIIVNQKEQFGRNSAGKDKKFVIEHTNINPNKAAHIGHVRNACLGDTLARLAAAGGYDVEIQNYIDDTGTAVADVVVGLHYLGRQPDPAQRFDYFCWDLYTEVNLLYEQDPALKARQGEVLHLIEQGDNPIANLAKETARKIVDCHLQTMWRFGIFYKLLTWESDIIHFGFWRFAFEKLKEQGGITYEESGPNQGCWVVKLGDMEEFSQLENPDKVLLRSNGTATYTAKDIAYQMWKFGVLGKDFLYAPYCRQPDGNTIWTSTLAGKESTDFGRADVVVNVIDIRQKYLQDVLRLSLHKLGYEKEAENSIHFGYEVVALSASAARELGVDVDDDREVYAMAGRKGIGVKADDLVEMIIQKTTEEVAKRHPEMSADEQAGLGRQIAVGAVRYYMVRYNINSVIVFDFAEALSLQGNTGPYLQYAHARAANIRRKAAADNAGDVRISFPAEMTDREKNLLKKMAELPVAVQKATKSLAPSLLADYAFSLATAFMSFYESVPVLVEDTAVRRFRLLLVEAFIQVLKNTLSILGIPAPERM
ncbi:MAG: arginine--tRNA ligase [bacterium]